MLRGWEMGQQPIHFAQQLRHGAVLSQDARLMADTAARLADLARRYLLLAWGTTRASPALIRVLSGHEASVLSVAVTPDGRRAVSASYDRTLRVWDLATGAEERVLSGHEDTIWSVAVTPDGRRAVSASSDRTLRVWDLNTGEELARIVLDGALQAVAVAPNGTTIVAGDAGGNVYCLEYVEPDPSPPPTD